MRIWILSVVLIVSVQCASAFDRTWTGLGADNNWTTVQNWSGGAVPSSLENVIFDASSVKDCTISGSQSAANFTVANGYTGTISSGSVNVSGNLLVQSGTVQSVSYTVGGNLRIEGGSVNYNSFNVTGG